MSKRKRIIVKKGIFAFSTNKYKEIQTKRVITEVKYSEYPFKIISTEITKTTKYYERTAN